MAKGMVMRSLAGLVICSLVLLSACSNDDPSGPDTATPAEIAQILEEAGLLAPLAEEQDEVTDTWTEESGGYRYTYEVHDVVDNIESIAFLGLNDDVIWPGSLIRGNQAHQFVYVPVTVARAPITLSVSLEGSSTSGDLTIVVADPRLSTVRQGISDLLETAVGENTHVPARVEFTMDQVYSESQMSLFVGANLSYGAGSLETAFNWDEGSTTNKIMAKYMQIYYTIDMDTPSSPSALFDPSVNAAGLAAALPPGSMPMYVGSVSYGMMALTCIETQFTEEQMGLALNAAYNGTVDVELDFGYTAREVLQSASMKTIVYGGSTQGLDNIELGFEGFMQVIDASTDFTPESPGVPLVYRFRHVADNTLALVTLTSQYTLVRPLQIEQLVRVQVNRYVCTMADDEGTDNAVDIDRFYFWVNAFNCLNGADPGTRANPQDQVVYSLVLADWVEMGDDHPVVHDTGGASVIIAFDTEAYDFSYAKLNLHAYVRDYDPASANEEAHGYLNLVGDTIWGEKTVMLYSSDFTFEVEVLISPVN